MAEKASTAAISAANSRLKRVDRSKIARCAGVNHQHDSQFPVLHVALHEWLARARGHVPVDGAHIIARQVWPYFVEIHTAPFEDRMVFAGEAVVDQAARAHLDTPNLCHQFAGDHE